MAVLRIEGLPAAPLDAAAAFYRDWLPRIRDGLAADESSVLVFPVADHSHRGWRLAAVQELARDHAPGRINAVACDGEQGLAEVFTLLDNCQGLTGQLLALDPTGVITDQP